MRKRILSSKLRKPRLEAAKVKSEATRILAEALLVEAQAKADGEEALITAKNQAEPQVLVSDAVLALVESLPQVTGELMKPAERIESIRVLDLGGNGGGQREPGRNEPYLEFYCQCRGSNATP